MALAQASQAAWPPKHRQAQESVPGAMWQLIGMLAGLLLAGCPGLHAAPQARTVALRGGDVDVSVHMPHRLDGSGAR